MNEKNLLTLAHVQGAANITPGNPFVSAASIGSVAQMRYKRLIIRFDFIDDGSDLEGTATYEEHTWAKGQLNLSFRIYEGGSPFNLLMCKLPMIYPYYQAGLANFDFLLSKKISENVAFKIFRTSYNNLQVLRHEIYINENSFNYDFCSGLPNDPFSLNIQAFVISNFPSIALPSFKLSAPALTLMAEI